MSDFPGTIVHFLERNRVATVCFSRNGDLHAINCFFAFDAELKLLYFKSSEGSNHDDLVFSGNGVAGAILPDMISVNALHGMQFRGNTLLPAMIDNERTALVYGGKFRFSRLLPGYFWAVRLVFVKFTDNRVRFGHKISWTRRAVRLEQQG